MPEWLIGLLSGVAITAFGVRLQERRETRKRGVGFIARLHVLFEEIKPTPLLLLASVDQERARRNGADLWRRWRELNEPLRAFAFEAAESVGAAVRETATHVSLSIQATRKAIDEADDPAAAPGLKRIAEEAYEVASDCVDDLDLAFSGRKSRRAFQGGRRRTR